MRKLPARATTVLGTTLALALAAACSGRAPRRRPDAGRTVDATARPADAASSRDAGPAEDAAHAPAHADDRTPLDLFAVGAAQRVRPGTAVQLRLTRFGAGDTRLVDITGEALFHVFPSTVGTIDRAGVFHATNLGRADITAQHRDAVVHLTLEVSSDMPPGVAVLPTLVASDGRVTRNVHLMIYRDGTLGLDVQAERLSAALRGPLRGRALPLTIAVRDGTPAPDAGAPDAALPDAGPGLRGTLELQRWLAGRLDGQVTLAMPAGPLVLRFTVPLPDVGLLFGRPPADAGTAPAGAAR